MKIKCENNGGKLLLVPDLASGNTSSTVFHATVGSEYVVYGILFFDRVINYLIVDNNGIPGWCPASLFAIVCGLSSRYWCFVNWSTNEKYIGVMTYPELIQNRKLAEQLILGDITARKVFQERRKLADLEFLDPAVTKMARAIDNGWLQCPFCAEGWESKSSDAMVLCPACQQVSRNPAYKDQTIEQTH